MTKTYELNIEGHKIVALGFNEDKPGIPAIFMHGVTTSVNFWTFDQTPIFEEQFRWYSLSLPGHYPAELPEGFQKEDLTAEMMARVMIAAIRELVGDQPVYLIGHSTGAFSALNIASHTPEIAAGVISVAGFAQGKWTGTLGIFQSAIRGNKILRTRFYMDFTALQKLPLINLIGWYTNAADFRDLHENLTRDLHEKLHAPFKHLDIDAMACYFSQMPDIDISENLSRITAPTLAMAGEKDPTVPPAQAQLIADKVPDSQHVVLEGIGHLVNLESPEEYHQIITDWMQKQGRA